MSLESIGLDRSLNAKTDKKDQILDLLRTLDTIIFLEVAILYYCDNLSLLLVLRIVSQVLYVQPRTAALTSPAPFPPVFTANLICLITHVVHTRPIATARNSRGYIHGGLIIVFEGQLGPISKWNLILLDCLIFALQTAMLIIGQEKLSLDDGKTQDAASPVQDIEAEEAGIRRSRDEDRYTANENINAIELDHMLANGNAGSRISQPHDEEESFILELDVKQSLRRLTQRKSASEQASLTASAQAANISTILGRIAAARARPET